MGSIVKHGSHIERSGFKIEQVKYAGGELSYIELLVVESDSRGKKIVVHQHQVGDGDFRGRFVECDDLDIGLRIFEEAFNYYKWYWTLDMGDRVKKVSYGEPNYPWFYSKDTNVVGDTFALE